MCFCVEGFLCLGEFVIMWVIVLDEGLVEVGFNVFELILVVIGGKEEVCCMDIVFCLMCFIL